MSVRHIQGSPDGHRCGHRLSGTDFSAVNAIIECLSHPAAQEEERAAHGSALTAVHEQLAEAQAAGAAAAGEAAGSAAEVEQAASLIDGLEQQVEALKEQLGGTSPFPNFSPPSLAAREEEGGGRGLLLEDEACALPGTCSEF